MLCGAGCSRGDFRPTTITDFYKDTLRLIGRGRWSFVKVYKSKTGQREYAVKTRLKKNMPMSQEWNYAEKHEWKFDKEEKILRKLVGHENIVSFVTSFAEQAQHCQVFELLNGADLYRSIIRKNDEPHCELHVIIYMRDILTALQYCHKNQIIHRNVIPPNLFLVPSPAGGDVKLVGFSLAVNAKQGKDSFGIVGTAGYRAPEITSVNKYHYPVDIFACGCVFYNLLTGTHPFISHTSEGTSFLSPAWKLVSADARDLVMKMLLYEDDERITASQAMYHPFFRNVARTGWRNPLTIAVDGLKEFTQQKMWETVASDDDTSCYCAARESQKSRKNDPKLTKLFW